MKEILPVLSNKKGNFYTLIYCLFTLPVCSQMQVSDLKRFVDDNGVSREYLVSFDSLLEATHLYDYLSNECNLDNSIYKPGKEFVFEYYYSKAGQCYYFDFQDEMTDLCICEQPMSAVLKVGYEIESGNLMGMTQINYNYYSRYDIVPNFEKSGIIENSMNIWLHPPRSNWFRMTEINPFPYIKSPFEVGKSWAWELEIGDQWGNKNWKTWDGNILNRYFYKITSKEIINSVFGKLLCYVIFSTAYSEIGQTSLTAYFNETYGFVKLFYKNIDGSELLMNLVEVKQE